MPERPTLTEIAEARASRHPAGADPSSTPVPEANVEAVIVLEGEVVKRNRIGVVTPMPSGGGLVTGKEDVPGLPAELDAIRALIAAAVSGTGLDFKQIAVSPAAITASVDVAGLTITAETTGQEIVLDLDLPQCSVNNTSSLVIVKILEGSTVIAQWNRGAGLVVNAIFPIRYAHRFTPAAGTHTYKVNLTCFVAGALNVTANDTARASFGAKTA